MRATKTYSELVRQFGRTITPETAREMLSHGHNQQRPLSRVHVRRISTAMIGGRWMQNTTQGISIGETGALLDGQHRLAALIHSGKTLSFLVFEGVPVEHYQYFDAGKPRAINDRVALVDGHRKNRDACALIRLWIQMETGEIKSEPYTTLEWFEAHAKSVEWIMGRYTREPKISTTPVLLALCQMYERDASAAESFARTYFAHDMDDKNAICLRDTIQKRESGSGATLQKSTWEKAVYICQERLWGNAVKYGMRFEDVPKGKWEARP